MRLMTESVKRMSEYREVLFWLLQKRTRAESLRQLRADRASLPNVGTILIKLSGLGGPCAETKSF